MELVPEENKYILDRIVVELYVQTTKLYKCFELESSQRKPV